MNGPTRRQPTWSGFLTRWLQGVIPPANRAGVLAGIRAVHTAIFGSIAGALVLTLWDGLRGSPTHRTAITGGIVLVESALYVTNNQVCPLTPLAEELGSGSGSVVDLYLPDAVARRVPLLAGSAFVIAIALNARALLRSMDRPTIG